MALETTFCGKMLKTKQYYESDCEEDDNGEEESENENSK
jgi:hypothetical protein